MIIAKGLGWITVLIIGGCIAVVLLLNEWTGHRVPDWITYFAMAIPAAIGNAIFVVPAARADRTIWTDPDTGQQFDVPAVNSLFWIPVRYWTFIILIYPVVGSWQDWTRQ